MNYKSWIDRFQDENQNFYRIEERNDESIGSRWEIITEDNYVIKEFWAKDGENEESVIAWLEANGYKLIKFKIGNGNSYLIGLSDSGERIITNTPEQISAYIMKYGQKEDVRMIDLEGNVVLTTCGYFVNKCNQAFLPKLLKVLEPQQMGETELIPFVPYDQSPYILNFFCPKCAKKEGIINNGDIFYEKVEYIEGKGCTEKGNVTSYKCICGAEFCIL